MIGATHNSKCGKWFYKPSSKKTEVQNFFRKERRMMFWDSYCNKWRESIMDMRYLNKIKGAKTA